MSRYSIPFPLLGVLLIITPLICVAQPIATPLHSGDMFPQFTGKTLTGKPLELPAVAAVKPAVVIFSFTRRAGKDAQLWSERIAKDYPRDVPCYTMIMLESVPTLFRGMVVSGIKGDMPPAVQDRTIVSYRDEELWKQRLAATDDSHAYVLLLGSHGHMHWRNSGTFNDAEYTKLKSGIQEQIKVISQHRVQ